jgi:hypothetical protein
MTVVVPTLCLGLGNTAHDILSRVRRETAASWPKMVESWRIYRFIVAQTNPAKPSRITTPFASPAGGPTLLELEAGQEHSITRAVAGELTELAAADLPSADTDFQLVSGVGLQRRVHLFVVADLGDAQVTDHLRFLESVLEEASAALTSQKVLCRVTQIFLVAGFDDVSALSRIRGALEWVNRLTFDVHDEFQPRNYLLDRRCSEFKPLQSAEQVATVARLLLENFLLGEWHSGKQVQQLHLPGFFWVQRQRPSEPKDLRNYSGFGCASVFFPAEELIAYCTMRALGGFVEGLTVPSQYDARTEAQNWIGATVYRPLVQKSEVALAELSRLSLPLLSSTKEMVDHARRKVEEWEQDFIAWRRRRFEEARSRSLALSVSASNLREKCTADLEDGLRRIMRDHKNGIWVAERLLEEACKAVVSEDNSESSRVSVDSAIPRPRFARYFDQQLRAFEQTTDSRPNPAAVLAIWSGSVAVIWVLLWQAFRDVRAPLWLMGATFGLTGLIGLVALILQWCLPTLRVRREGERLRNVVSEFVKGVEKRFDGNLELAARREGVRVLRWIGRHSDRLRNAVAVLRGRLAAEQKAAAEETKRLLDEVNKPPSDDEARFVARVAGASDFAQIFAREKFRSDDTAEEMRRKSLAGEEWRALAPAEFCASARRAFADHYSGMRQHNFLLEEKYSATCRDELKRALAQLPVYLVTHPFDGGDPHLCLTSDTRYHRSVDSDSEITKPDIFVSSPLPNRLWVLRVIADIPFEAISVE